MDDTQLWGITARVIKGGESAPCSLHVVFKVRVYLIQNSARLACFVVMTKVNLMFWFP